MYFFILNNEVFNFFYLNQNVKNVFKSYNHYNKVHKTNISIIRLKNIKQIFILLNFFGNYKFNMYYLNNHF